ncbi:MAG: MFS transporter [Gammaproteobacteria bacterium]
MMPNEVSLGTKPLSLRLCLGWGIGTFGVSVMFNSVNLLLQRFATDFLGIAAATFGLIYLITKIYDAVSDPLMGWISDRTRSRFGRRRPYLVLGGQLCAVAIIALFNAPTVEETPNPALILGLLLILYSTGYTVFNVPYLAMPVEMTTDYMERSRLVSFRVYAIGFGSLAGLWAAPSLIAFFGGGQAGHVTLAWVYGVLILAASLLSFWMTRGARATVRSTREALPRKEQLRLIASNKPFLILVSVKFCHLASLAVAQAAYVYFVVYVLDEGYYAVGLLGLANATGVLIGTPVWYVLARRLRNKRNLYMAASLLAAVVLSTWLLATSGEQIGVTMFRQLLYGMATGGSLMFGLSMLPDAIAQDAARSGMRREGVFAGIFSMAEKMAFAVGGSASGLLLGAMGYISSTTGTAAQPDSAILAVYLCVSVLPAGLLVLSVLLLTQYNLGEEEVRRSSVLAAGGTLN